MDAVTYSSPIVLRFIREHLVPVRLPYDAEPYAARFRVKWTPMLVLLDGQGQEVFRTEGYLPPDDLVPTLMLPIAKEMMAVGAFDEAERMLSDLVRFYPKSDQAPEGVYFRGVARYKKKGDARALKEAYDMLAASYPGSSWTRRALPFRTLQ